KRFVWNESPQPGVYVEIEASAFGKELVDGKVMRAFSPSFLSDAALPKRVGRGQHVTVPAGQRGSLENPARMTGLCFPACGTLTNNPAFRKILPLWARNQPNTQPQGSDSVGHEVMPVGHDVRSADDSLRRLQIRTAHTQTNGENMITD